MQFRILKQDPKEIEEYLRMRALLWPKHEKDELRVEAEKILTGQPFYKGELSWTVFVAIRSDGNPGGFLELSVYPEKDYCKCEPVGYVEGWYVDSDLRGRGVGRSLVDAGVEHLRRQGIREIASDAELDNLTSHLAHLAIGFEEVHDDGTCAYYRMDI